VDKIEVAPYDPHWPELFESEKAILRPILTEIHHVGSTSVPGLAAKPKIDIVAVAIDQNNFVSNLESVGYAYRGSWNVPLKYGFTKRGITDVNLHVFLDPDHPEIGLNLVFRDYLRTHPDVRDEYAAVKREILKAEDAQEKINGFPVYTIRKRDFIDGVIKAMRYNRLRVLKCITEKESSFIKNFQEGYEYFILYKGADIIGYAAVRNGEVTEYHAPDTESSEYLLNTVTACFSV
jgi:GrpB-like predicted nucleotidyltransferase (UPF0157 family)